MICFNPASFPQNPSCNLPTLPLPGLLPPVRESCWHQQQVGCAQDLLAQFCEQHQKPQPPSQEEMARLGEVLCELGLNGNPVALLAVCSLLGVGFDVDGIVEFLEGCFKKPPAPCQEPKAAGGTPESASGGSSEPSGAAGSQPSCPPATAGPSTGSQPSCPPATTGPSTASQASCPQSTTPPTCSEALPEDRAGLEAERAETRGELDAASGELSTVQAALSEARNRGLTRMGADVPACDREAFRAAQERYQAAQSQVAALRGQRASKVAEMQQTQAEITVQEAKREAATADVESANSDLAALRSQRASLGEEEDCAGIDADIAAAERRLEEAQRRLTEANTELERLNALKEAQSAELLTIDRELQAQQQLVAEALTELDALRNLPEGSTEQELAASSEVQAAQARVDEVQARIDALRARLAEIDNRIAQIRVQNQHEQPPSAGTLPSELIGQTGGEGSALTEGLDASDGYNCWESSATYAAANPGQQVQLLSDSDGTNHAVAVSEDGEWVTFDGTNQVDPPVRVEDYLARSRDYQRFVRADQTSVGPVDPQVLLDPALRAQALRPGGALDGVPAGELFADSGEQVHGGITISEWRNRLATDPAFQVFRDLQSTDSAAALRWLMTDPTLPGTTVGQRMDFILDLTNDDGSSGMTHFALGFNDSGFRPELQDGYLWGANSHNQVGHFLTAVDIGIHENGFLMRCALGHEQYPDVSTGSGTSNAFYQGIQCVAGDLNAQDLGSLSQAILDASAQTDPARAKAIIDAAVDQMYIAEGTGNSREDMRLTSYGIFLGRIVGTYPQTELSVLSGFMDAFVAQPGQPASTGLARPVGS